MTKTSTAPQTAKTQAGQNRKRGKADANQPVAEASTPKTSKSDTLIAMLSRPEGATIQAMMTATGWQAHSVRGFLAGTLKRKLGKAVTSETTEGGRTYRIAEASAA